MVLDVRSGGGFVAGEIQVGIEGIEDDHGEFGAEGVEFFFGPAAIEAGGSADVFGKSLAVVAFADEDVADKASGMDVVGAAAGLAVRVGEAEKHFAIAGKFRPIVPSLRRVDFGVMALGAVNPGLLVDKFFRRIEVQDALAGVANDGFVAGADIVIGLRPEHDLARHALLMADFGDAAAAEL